MAMGPLFMRTLTQELLKTRLFYDAETGLFTWACNYGKARSGSVAGYVAEANTTCYLKIGLLGKEYKAHRLAFFWMTGEWPTSQVDHINRNSLDNRWSNLRDATPNVNLCNTRLFKHNTSGYRGVSFNRACNRWQAHFKWQHKSHYLGLFATPEEAACAYDSFASLVNPAHRSLNFSGGTNGS
jgi:hypothetical protein